jgi:tRNA A37 threonylcarbamoyladenosine synthetase subunit TsaC/SUA5/YrdC
MGVVVKFEDFMDNIDFYVSEAKSGKVFIYPTDTIY